MYAYDSNTKSWIPLRSTKAYQNKKRTVRNTWIVSGLFMCIMSPVAVLVSALLLTFLSFMYLDETRYPFEIR